MELCHIALQMWTNSAGNNLINVKLMNILNDHNRFQGKQSKRELSNCTLEKVSVPFGKSGHYRIDSFDDQTEPSHLLQQEQSPTLLKDKSVHQQQTIS